MASRDKLVRMNGEVLTGWIWSVRPERREVQFNADQRKRLTRYGFDGIAELRTLGEPYDEMPGDYIWIRDGEEVGRYDR